MESAKVPEAFRLDQGARGQRAYAPYLEERAKHQKGTIKAQSLQALRPPRRGEKRLVGQNDTVSYLPPHPPRHSGGKGDFVLPGGRVTSSRPLSDGPSASR